MAGGSTVRIETVGSEGVEPYFPYLSRKMLTELELIDFYLALESVGATEEEIGILKGMRKRLRKSEWKRVYDQRVSAYMIELTTDLEKLGSVKCGLIAERNSLLKEIEEINRLLSDTETS